MPWCCLILMVLVTQVRDDMGWWNEPGNTGSGDDQSEDPNAEDW